MMQSSPIMPDIAPGPHDLKLEVPGTADSVREVLRWLLINDPMLRLPEDVRGAAELVLAEALNNVVEHAYARFSGTVRIMMTRKDDGLRVVIEDDGLEMPGYDLPAGELAEPKQTEELLEGGYGWFLIRRLTKSLAYRRLGGCNRLSFLLEPKQLN